MPADFVRLFHTVRYLKPVQIYGRVLFRLKSPKPDLQPAPKAAEPTTEWQSPIDKTKSLIEPGRLRFLNQEHEIKSATDWNNSDWDKLWLYNLHYFDDLSAEFAGDRKTLHVELIERWIKENPPGEGNGWEPYPSSLRIVNWIKWSLAGNSLSDQAAQSLAVQTRFLCKRLEYHLLGNHLFANAKALVFAGLSFDGEESQAWLNKGLYILAEQVPEQILDDGGHFERSPMYHAIILEDLLDLINIMRTYGEKVPVDWKTHVQRMIPWLEAMCHPDGQITLFNDAAFGISAKLEQLSAYANRLELDSPFAVTEGLTTLPESGYLRWQGKEAVALLDSAPIGPDYLSGHAHADTLNFELSLFGQRLIVDSGTSCYGVSDERLRQRGTAAHNTVTIDDQDSSEVWSGFRVARRAKPFGLKTESDSNVTTVCCAHDGYWRLTGRPTHRREWIFEGKQITIKDRVDGDFTKAVARFHLHPDVSVNNEDDVAEGEMVLQAGQKVHWRVIGGSVELIDTTYHPEFGLSIPNKCLVVTLKDNSAELLLKWI